jgi:hypothetical protein
MTVIACGDSGMVCDLPFFHALRRQAPKLRDEVDLAPSHAADFPEALPGQDQQLQH